MQLPKDVVEKAEPGAAIQGYNETLEKYSAGVKEIAEKNKGLFADQFGWLGALLKKSVAFQTRTVRFEDESLVFGPSFHYVTDLADRGGWYHVPGGASERRSGPGYGKGVDLWATGRFIALGNPKGKPPTA